jgi:hypothetical protein
VAGWDAFRAQLDNHHSAEDDGLWPVLRRELSDPGDLAAVEAMVAEHQQIPPALAGVDAGLRGGGELTAPVEHLSMVSPVHNGNRPGIITSITFTRNKTAEMIPTARSAPGLPARAALSRSGRTTANTATITAWTHASRVARCGAVADKIPVRRPCPARRPPRRTG